MPVNGIGPIVIVETPAEATRISTFLLLTGVLNDSKIELAVKSVPVECGLVCFTDLIFCVLYANVDTTVLPEFFH